MQRLGKCARLAQLLAFAEFARSTGTPIPDENCDAAITLWRANEAAATSTYGHVSAWDVSRVTNMSFAFHGASAFNANLSLDFDTSAVTDMAGMIWAAFSFDQPLDFEQWVVPQPMLDSKRATTELASEGRVVVAEVRVRHRGWWAPPSEAAR